MRDIKCQYLKWYVRKLRFITVYMSETIEKKVLSETEIDIFSYLYLKVSYYLYYMDRVIKQLFWPRAIVHEVIHSISGR